MGGAQSYDMTVVPIVNTSFVLREKFWFRKLDIVGFEFHSNKIPRPEMPSMHFGAEFNPQAFPNPVDDDYNTNSGVARRDPVIMPIMETPVSYSKLVSREIVVDNLPVTTTDAEGTFIKLYNVPQDFLANCQQKQAFNNNYLGRGNVKVKVTVSSSQFHQGMLCVFFAPMISKMTFETLWSGDKTQISNLQCGYIDLNRPQPLEMIINYSHLENYLRLQSASEISVEGSLGVFGVHVFDALQVATGGSTSVNAAITVSFDGWEFYLPVAVDTCSSLSLPRKFTSRRTPKFEQHGNHVSNISNSYTVFKNISDSMMATELHGDEFDNKQSADLQVDASLEADASNMDKPCLPINPQVVTLKNSQYFNNETNIESLNKLTLVASEQCPAKRGHFGRINDECSIRYIASKSSFIAEVPWTTTNVPGDQLFSLLLGSSPINNSIRPVPTGDSDPISQSYLDYLSGQFMYWRGRTNIHFKIVASNFQTGILRVGIVYGKYDATATANEANCQFMEIIDLKEGKREYNFTAEFPATTQYLACDSTHRLQMTSDQIAGCSVGTMYLHVINPLTVGVGATNNIHIQVFASSSDIEYFFMRPAQVEANTPNLMSMEAYKAKRHVKVEAKSDFKNKQTSTFQQQSATGDFAPQLSQGQASMGAPGTVVGTVPAKVTPIPKRGHVTNLAPIKSLRMIMKRYMKIYNNNSIGNGNVLTFNIIDLTGVNTQPWQWLCMYAAYRGNMRWKIYQIGTGTGGSAFYQVWAGVPGSTASPAIDASFQSPWDLKCGSDNNHCFEEETSFVTPYNYMLNPAFVQPGTAENAAYTDCGSLKTIVTWTAGTGNTVLQTVLWAGGDDFRMGLLIGPTFCTVHQFPV